jgi:hypothetical protein
VVVYAGQRRFLAAQRSPELAGTEGFEGLKPLGTLLVRLLDYTPTDEDIRRIQAQENQREDLSLRDRQDQFDDCFRARVGLPEDQRVASVCEALGMDPQMAWNLRRQLTLPEPLRARVSEKPTGDQLSVTLANRLADMSEVSPALMEAVAARVTTSEYRHQALNSPGEFVHQTVVETPDLYAVRLEEGRGVLDAHQQLERAREHLTEPGRETLAQTFGCEPDKLEGELQALSARAAQQTFRLDVDSGVRERAAAGRYAWVQDRGLDYAAAMWVIAPEFMIAAIYEAIGDGRHMAGRDESYFGASSISDEDVENAEKEEAARRAEARQRHEQATSSNLGLGYDVSTGLLDPRGEQLDALRAIVVRLLAEHYPSLVAYGAGWTSRERQQPVGDTGRFEPLAVSAIVDAEVQRALDDPDPLRGIAQLVARWAAAFTLDPDGVPRTTTLGTDRITRQLQATLPGGDSPLRRAVWAFMRPMLSPRLVEINRDEFLPDDSLAAAADLEAARADTDLSEIDLGEEQKAA